MTVQFPSLLVVNFGVGRFLLTKAKVAASLAPPHSILTRCSVSTVKRALPTCTTASELGLGSDGDQTPTHSAWGVVVHDHVDWLPWQLAVHTIVIIITS